MIDVHLPTTDGREIVLTRYTQPEPELQLLINQLKLTLPSQPPPKITAAALAQITPEVKTFWSKLLIQHTPDRRFRPNPRRRVSSGLWTEFAAKPIRLPRGIRSRLVAAKKIINIVSSVSCPRKRASRLGRTCRALDSRLRGNDTTLENLILNEGPH